MRRARRVLLVVLGTLASGTLLAEPAAARVDSPRAVGISSIAPAVADRGGTVTITGNGFGGPNVQITVGGVRAHLISATGNRATFRVPPLAGPGDVLVRATNPGGQTATIGLGVRFDGNVAVAVDDAAAVSGAVTGDGGTIDVAGMTLAIPAGALPEGTTITATPVRSLHGSPFAAAPVGVKLEPSGTVLLRPATLTLPKPAGAGTVVGFGFDGDGEEFHLVPHEVVGDTVELKVWHFSGAGTLTATLEELNAVLGYETTRAHGRAEQRIEAALVDAELNGTDPGPAIFDALADWRGSASNGMSVARDSDQLDDFELAFGEWQAWIAYMQEYRDTVGTASSDLDAFLRFDTSYATRTAYEVGLKVLAGCIGPGLPRSALRDTLRLASMVQLASLPIDGANDPDERQLPDGPNLASGCIDIRITAVEHAPTFARNRNNSLKVRAQVVFWSGDPSSTIPLRYRLAGIATEVTSNGLFSLTRRPSELGTDELQLTVDLDTSGTDTVLRTIFEQRHLSIPVRERLDLQARRPTDAAFGDFVGAVAPGGTFLLRIRLAGDDVAGKAITLFHDGNGTLPATATTDSVGQATVTYTAPATPQIELVTASIDDGGLTSADALVITTREPIVVDVTPSFGFTNTGGTLQFTATVTGTTDQRVSWNVSGSGNTISATGLLTAGSTQGTFAVTATSLADTTSSDTAFVNVTGGTVEGRYTGTVCTYDDLGGESCSAGATLDYHCDFQSNLHAGRTCGFGDPFHILIPFCFVETDGTTAGGSFRGVVTFCRFRPASSYAATVFVGTVGNGRLEMNMFAPGFDGAQRLWEHISMTKAP